MPAWSHVSAKLLVGGLCGALCFGIGFGGLVAGLVMIPGSAVPGSSTPAGGGGIGRCTPRPGDGFLCEVVELEGRPAYRAVLNASIALEEDGSVSNCSRFLGARHAELAACQGDAQSLLSGQERDCVAGAGGLCEELVRESQGAAISLIVGGAIWACLSAGWLGAIFLTGFVERIKPAVIIDAAAAIRDDSSPRAVAGGPWEQASPPQALFAKSASRSTSLRTSSSPRPSPRGSPRMKLKYTG